MRSETTADFWKLYASLPTMVQRTANKTFALWRAIPNHPSLHFKPLGSRAPVYSVRVGMGYRALGVRDDRDGDVIVWFWIGTHAEYDRLLKGS